MDLRAELQATIGSQYTLKQELGAGMSRVFVATEHALMRDVVIKVLPQDLAAYVSIERFKREILLAARLQHAHIVPLLSAGESRGLPFYTMPFVEGESLRSRLNQPEPVSPGDAVRMLREIASALSYAHERGVVHRDIKPDNVLLSAGSAMVSDFGVAKALFASSNAESGLITSKGLILGTPAYMAPEQVGGDENVDHRADIYSFGVLAYEVVAGARPFSASAPHEVRAAHLSTPPEPLAERAPNLPAPLANLIMQCLAKDPDKRPQSAAEIMRRLDGVLTTHGHARAGGGSVGAWRRRATRAAATPFGRVALGVVAVGAVAIFAWRGGVGSRTTSTEPTSALPGTAIAVLPFANVGGDTATDYFADGMTDAVANQMARLAGVRVAARTSAFRYKGKTADPAEVGRTLSVSSIVVGSVQRANNQVRVTVQLVNAADGLTRWADQYDKPLTRVFELQGEIARAIAGALQLTIGDSAAVQSQAGTQNVEAFDLYLRGVATALKYTEADLRRAIGLFERAVALDPRYAAPWAGIAKAWISLADEWLPPREAYPRAEAAVERALALDSMSAPAHAMRATLAFDYDWNVPLAARHFRRAVALEAGNADARLQFARVLARMGQKDSSALLGRQAALLDPNSGDIAGQYAHLLIRIGAFDSALVWIERERMLEPTSDFVAFDMGFLHMAQGRCADALRAFRSIANAGASVQANIAVCEAMLQRPQEARRVLARLEAERARKYVAGDRIARIYVALGDTDNAMKWLETAFTERAAALNDLTGFTWDPIRADPRFGELQQRIARARN